VSQRPVCSGFPALCGSADALVPPAGGKDGLVGFPDFVYKHIVPACFLAPLKPTFDLSDAQTVLVSPCSRVPGPCFPPVLSPTRLCFADAVGVRAHAENDSSQTGKNCFFLALCSVFSVVAEVNVCVVPSLQGLEFIQFLQQEYLPSLQVSPEIAQVTPAPAPAPAPAHPFYEPAAAPPFYEPAAAPPFYDQMD